MKKSIVWKNALFFMMVCTLAFAVVSCSDDEEENSLLKEHVNGKYSGTMDAFYTDEDGNTIGDPWETLDANCEIKDGKIHFDKVPAFTIYKEALPEGYGELIEEALSKQSYDIIIKDAKEDGDKIVLTLEPKPLEVSIFVLITNIEIKLTIVTSGESVYENGKLSFNIVPTDLTMGGVDMSNLISSAMLSFNMVKK